MSTATPAMPATGELRYVVHYTERGKRRRRTFAMRGQHSMQRALRFIATRMLGSNPKLSIVENGGQSKSAAA